MSRENQTDSTTEKEVSISALLTVRDMLGWGEKTVLFSGATLADFLKLFTTKAGENLYHALVEESGAVRPEYTVRLNNRPVQHKESLKTPLEPGDHVVVMPVMKLAAGG